MGEKSASGILGPIVLKGFVHFTDGQGVFGFAEVGLSPGAVPTEERLVRAMGNTLAAIPEGCRLLNADEFFNQVLVKERTGRVGKFALPGSMDYDLDAVTERARAAYVPSPEEVADEGDIDEEDEDE